MNMIEPGQSVVSESGRLHDSATEDAAILNQDHDVPNARRLGALVTTASIPDPLGLLAAGLQSTRLFTPRERTSTGLAQGG